MVDRLGVLKNALRSLTALALLCTLLPGPALWSPNPLRVCLHHFMQVDDGCSEPDPSVDDEGERCCRDEPVLEIVAEASGCDACCIELPSTGTALSASAALDALGTLPPLAPLAEVVLVRPLPAACVRVVHGAARPPDRTGRASLPLRI